MLRKLVVPGLALAATAITAATAATSAAAHPGHGSSSQGGAQSVQQAPDAYFAATLLGKNEVKAPGTKVGDKDGIAVAVFRIHGNKVEYAVRWQGTAAPTAFHIHQGVKGRNGDVKIGFFMGSALPGTLSAVKGSVTVDDGALLNRIRTNPAGWYVNLHTGEFPGGAVRAQLHRIKPVHLDTVLATGSRSTLTAIADGRQEVPAPGTKVGDKNGKAVWLVWVKGTKVHFATVWKNIAQPTLAHIHKAPKGKNGPVVVDFFSAPSGLPAGVNGIAGTGTASSSVAKGIKKNPKNWYTNLHTSEFPGGAVRGQLHGGGW